MPTGPHPLLGRFPFPSSRGRRDETRRDEAKCRRRRTMYEVLRTLYYPGRLTDSKERTPPRCAWLNSGISFSCPIIIRDRIQSSLQSYMLHVDGWVDGWEGGMLHSVVFSSPPPSSSLPGFARVHGCERCYDALGCIHRYNPFVQIHLYHLLVRHPIRSRSSSPPWSWSYPICSACFVSYAGGLHRCNRSCWGYRSHSIKTKDEQEDPEVLVVFRPLLPSFMDTQKPLKMHHALIVQIMDSVWLLSQRQAKGGVAYVLSV